MENLNEAIELVGGPHDGMLVSYREPPVLLFVRARQPVIEYAAITPIVDPPPQYHKYVRMGGVYHYSGLA